MEDFIRTHLNDDVQALLLSAHRYPGIDMVWAAQQIAGWQTARQKLPLWAATPGIHYPVRLSMEQCSSQAAAQYKATIITPGERMADLTAGFGVDAAILSRNFRHLHCAERDESLCALLADNLPLLTTAGLTISCAEAEQVLPSLPHQDLIYLDPARRSRQGGRVYAISDCTPNVLLLQDQLLSQADTVLLKLSPMLDLTALTRQLHDISEIHVVGIAGECKEILVKMRQGSSSILYFCVNIGAGGAPTERLQFTAASERQSFCTYAAAPDRYLYEPNACIMKAGCFATISDRYGVQKLSPDSHLFTSHEFVPSFPGRTFQVLGTSGLGKKDLHRQLAGIRQANITVRNFPLSAQELRKKLKLADGGPHYLFATTLSDGTKTLILTQKPPSLVPTGAEKPTL